MSALWRFIGRGFRPSGIPSQSENVSLADSTMRPGRSRIYTVKLNSSAGKLVSPKATELGAGALSPRCVWLRHFSNSIAVGSKPATVCDYAIARISQNVQFYTVEGWGGSTAVGPVFPAGTLEKRVTPNLQQHSLV